jgi:hypothetical protein
MLVAVMEYAEFCSKLGSYERAVELCSLVQNHFVSWNETKKKASILLDSIKKSLPHKHFNETQKHGRSLDLWKTLEGLIKENITAGTKTSKSLHQTT